MASGLQKGHLHGAPSAKRISNSNNKSLLKVVYLYILNKVSAAAGFRPTNVLPCRVTLAILVSDWSRASSSAFAFAHLRSASTVQGSNAIALFCLTCCSSSSASGTSSSCIISGSISANEGWHTDLWYLVATIHVPFGISGAHLLCPVFYHQ